MLHAQHCLHLQKTAIACTLGTPSALDSSTKAVTHTLNAAKAMLGKKPGRLHLKEQPRCTTQSCSTIST
jgi:hypothetical protein